MYIFILLSTNYLLLLNDPWAASELRSRQYLYKILIAHIDI